MRRLIALAFAATFAAHLSGASLGPGDQLIATFTTLPNTSDILIFFNNQALTFNGTPVMTTTLYNGQTTLGKYTGRLITTGGAGYFVAVFASTAGGAGVANYGPTKLDFTSINSGTINGRMVTEVTGGSISGFDLSKFVLQDGVSQTDGYRPMPNVTRINLTLQTAPALPHLAAGDTWTTGIFLFNTGSVPTSYGIVFRDDDGNTVPLPFNIGSSSVVTGTLPAFGSAYIEAGDPRAELKVAWGQITADSSVVVQGLFRNNVSGTYYEAGVPSTSGARSFTIAFDATTFAASNLPIYTGIAIANLDSSASAVVTCTARRSTGTVIPEAVAVPAIKPFGHWANYLFPALTGQRGTIECTSTTSVSALALRFIGTNAFSTLPVIMK